MGNFMDDEKLIFENNLPSKRWKTRRIRTAFDKRLRRVEKEYDRVWEQIRNLGYEDLNPPVQRGYKRLFVLTEETRYSSRADFYRGILDKINTIWYSPHKTFKERKRKIAKWRYQRRNEQLLQQPDDWTFRNKKFTEEEAKYFFPVEYYDYPCKMWRVRYVFCEPWRFVLRVRPHMLTQIQRRDPELETYSDELDKIRERYRGRLTKLRGGNTSGWYRWYKRYAVKEKYRYNPLYNKPIHEIMETYNTEKDLWEYGQKI